MLALLVVLLLTAGVLTCIASSVTNNVGWESVAGVYRLYAQGSVRVKSWTAWPPCIQGLEVSQPARLGGHKILRVRRLTLQTRSLPSIWQAGGLVVELEGPWLNGLADLVGQLHLVNLLVDVGFWTEVDATGKPEAVSRQALESSKSHPLPSDGSADEDSGGEGGGGGKPRKRGRRLRGLLRRRGRRGQEDAGGGEAAGREEVAEEAAPGQQEGAAPAAASPTPARASGLTRSAKVMAGHRKSRDEEELASRESDPLAGKGFPAPEEAGAAGDGPAAPSRPPPQGTSLLGAAPRAQPSASSEEQGGTGQGTSEAGATFEERLHKKPAVASGSSITAWSGAIALPGLRLELREGGILFHDEVRQVVGTWVRLEAVLGTPLVRRAAEAHSIDTAWLRPENWPPGDARTGVPRFAVGLKVDGENLAAKCGGWRTSTGFLLRAPIASTVAFTPALAKYVLARLHPLLAHCIAVEENRDIQVNVAPIALHIPSEAYTIRMQPLKLRVRASAMLRGAIRLLEYRSRGGRQGGMECWTGAVEAEFYRSGELISKRLDVLVSKDFRVSKAPLHIAAWGRGTLDAQCGSVIDATLAVPAYSLRIAGLPGLPDNYMLQLSAYGSVLNPKVDWIGAAKSLAALVVQRNLPSLGIKGVRRWLDHKAEKRVAALGPIPPPTHPLPWTAFLKMPQRQNASRRRDMPAAPSLEECIRLGITDGDAETVKPSRSKPKAWHVVDPPKGEAALESQSVPEGEQRGPPEGAHTDEDSGIHMSEALASQLQLESREERGECPACQPGADSGGDEEDSSDSDGENHAPNAAPNAPRPRITVHNPGSPKRAGGPPSLASIRHA